jgi:hypothetical protein
MAIRWHEHRRSTNVSLTLTDVQASRAGTYSVTVTDAAGSTTSSNAVLTTVSPPTITSSPASQSVVAETTVTFSASATGTSPLSYQWQFDGANIPGATNASLTITNVQTANAGNYTMTVNNPFGSAVTSNAVLTIALLPFIGTQPQSQVGIVGSNVTLSVSVEPSVTSGALQLWLRRGRGRGYQRVWPGVGVAGPIR